MSRQREKGQKRPQGRRFRINPRAWAWGGLIVASLALLPVETTLSTTLYGIPIALSMVIVLLHIGSLPLALARPRVAAILSVLIFFALALAGSGQGDAPWPLAVAAMITQVLVLAVVGWRTNWMTAGLAWLGGVVAAILAVLVLPGARDPQESTADIVVFASISIGTAIAGVVLKQWQRISSQLIQEQETGAEERERRQLAEERTRIARELHDVVAHSMSIVSVQATSAPYRHPGLDRDVVTEFEQIAAASRTALAEMRNLLGVLRNEEFAAELAPQPGFPDIRELVEESTKAGLRIELRWSDGGQSPEIINEVVGLTAYRIVQEALSNVIRHAPGASVRVECALDARAITLAVVNSATIGSEAPAVAGASTGLGLVGMRERVAALGGAVTLGATPDGGFAVRATLPLGQPGGAEGDVS